MKIIGGAGLVLALGLGLSACSQVHEPETTGTVERSSYINVNAQISYAKTHYKNPNKSEFGDLGGTDCVNFVSQTLLQRGWKMDSSWAFSLDSSGTNYSRPWISSTGLRDYLAEQPQLATQLTWSQRDLVKPGDIVQFDWDASGDRDHTAIVSGIESVDGKRIVLLASHSPAAFDWPIEDAVAEHGSQTKVYFWSLKP